MNMNIYAEYIYVYQGWGQGDGWSVYLSIIIRIAINPNKNL